MPAEVLNDPLGISCVFSDGRRATVALGDIAGARLARDLLTGLAELVHPHGTVDSAGTVRYYVRALRVMTSVLAERDFTGGAADLRRAQVAEFWMGTATAHEALSRRMLLGFAAAGGTLNAGVRELAEGRAFHPQYFRPPAAALPGGRLVPAGRGCPGCGDDGLPRAPGGPHRGSARPGSRHWRLRSGQPAVAAGPQRADDDPRRRGARGSPGRRGPPAMPASRSRAVPPPGMLAAAGGTSQATTATGLPAVRAGGDDRGDDAVAGLAGRRGSCCPRGVPARASCRRDVPARVVVFDGSWVVVLPVAG
jgi:hypothetical protein